MSAPTKSRARRWDSIEAERRFRARVAALGGRVIEPEWLGISKPHRVVCAAGHACAPRPGGVLKGQGICLACAGKCPKAAEQEFRARVAAQGGQVIEPTWLGVHKPHRVICAEGHACAPHPANLGRHQQDICRSCAGKDPQYAWKQFKERVTALGGQVIESSWLGSHEPHRAICAAGHECAPIPNLVRMRGGMCRTCVGQDPAAAYKKFCVRITELGGRVVESEWLGSQIPHRVICPVGHHCRPRPAGIISGQGMCNECVGNDSAAAYREFQRRVAALGGTLVEREWLGCKTAHRVICPNGHGALTTPGNLLRGRGLCGKCAGQGYWDVFYVVHNPQLHRVKFGISTNDPRDRVGVHRQSGYTEVVRTMQSLPTAAELERHVMATLDAAGLKPVQGREYYDVSALSLILDVADHWEVAA